MSSNNASVDYYLSNAFEYEIRNVIEVRIFMMSQQQDQLEDMTERMSDDLQKLLAIKEYLHGRIGEMRARII